jgi:hypothetical protein
MIFSLIMPLKCKQVGKTSLSSALRKWNPVHVCTLKRLHAMPVGYSEIALASKLACFAI